MEYNIKKSRFSKKKTIVARIKKGHRKLPLVRERVFLLPTVTLVAIFLLRYIVTKC